MNTNANTLNLAGCSFSETLAMIRLGQIDAPVTVLTVDLAHDLIMIDHGDVDVMVHESQASIHVDDRASAGELAATIAEGMADWGTGYAAVWFTRTRVHYSHRHAVDPHSARMGGTGENN